MSGEKTEEPTEKKLQDAREKGQLPARKNVLEAFLLTIGVLTIASLAPEIGSRLMIAFDTSIQGVTVDFSEAIPRALSAAWSVLTIGILISIVFGISVLLINLYLNKFNFAIKAMQIKFEKLNPVMGLKNMFSKTTLYNFGRLMVYFPCIVIVFYIVVSRNLRDATDAASCGIPCILPFFQGLLIQEVTLIIVVLLILAAVDYKIQNALHKKQNKMTKDEVKREYKGQEGDPQIKGQRRQIAEEDAHMPTMKDVSHVVFSNKHLVAFIYLQDGNAFIVMKATGDAVANLQSKFRQLGKACVNLPAVAKELHANYPNGTYTDERARDALEQIVGQ